MIANSQTSNSNITQKNNTILLLFRFSLLPLIEIYISLFDFFDRRTVMFLLVLIYHLLVNYSPFPLASPSLLFHISHISSSHVFHCFFFLLDWKFWSMQTGANCCFCNQKNSSKKDFFLGCSLLINNEETLEQFLVALLAQLSSLHHIHNQHWANLKRQKHKEFKQQKFEDKFSCFLLPFFPLPFIRYTMTTEHEENMGDEGGYFLLLLSFG